MFIPFVPILMTNKAIEGYYYYYQFLSLWDSTVAQCLALMPARGFSVRSPASAQVLCLLSFHVLPCVCIGSIVGPSTSYSI